ncbi:tRNA 2-thiouridine(34) synthase MnmA [Lacibacterium aquatile]|uniref:tRNA-specific 2-thiouridylase MnmA n=1 Tax=Lacibacterium aquatile TaxID=1168082 RepID=A0ABW5DPK0_9PROT
MNSLGFDKAPSATRVVVAMSGGVDSSVVAAMLAEQGYDVIGVTLQLYDQGEVAARKGACCAGQDIYDARTVADKVGIPHYVLDYESKFRDAVVEEFADSYARGETPIPCVMCNKTVKFRDLLATARELGADCLATGHYVQRAMGTEGAELLRGRDPGRDQSYFLFSTTRDQLDYLRFPLGHLDKAATRREAERLGLIVKDKPDSQDICFVPDGDYARIVTKLRPDTAQAGEIVDIDGTVLGRHDGIIHYTVGQRRGLGIAAAEPLYVVRLEPNRRRVVVGPKSALGRDLVHLREVNWLTDLKAGDSRRVSVKLRSAQMPTPATVIAGVDGAAVVQLDTPQPGIAPGQAGVFYDGDRLLGGGWIARTELQPELAA